MVIDPEWGSEFNSLMDDISYEVSNARAAGLEKPEQLRDVLKAIREKVTQADNLAISAGAELRRAEDG